MVFANKRLFNNKDGDIHIGMNAPSGFLECTLDEVKATLTNLAGRKLWRCHVCNDLAISKIPPSTCPTCFQIDAYVEINEKELRGLLQI